jgi:hypothetical protein
LGKNIFFCSLRTIGGSGDPPPGTQNRHVSLANIATAFLTERKSSSHRQSSARRKKRLTINGRTSSTNSARQSNYPTAADEILGQRSSSEIMDGGIPTIFVLNTDNKHRSTTVKKTSLT